MHAPAEHPEEDLAWALPYLDSLQLAGSALEAHDPRKALDTLDLQALLAFPERQGLARVARAWRTVELQPDEWFCAAVSMAAVVACCRDSHSHEFNVPGNTWGSAEIDAEAGDALKWLKLHMPAPATTASDSDDG